MQDDWEELAEDMLEEQIFLADVDAVASPQLAQRFQITTIPTYILLRNRKMYTKGPSAVIEELKNWALKDWQQSLDSMVPPENETFNVMAVVTEVVSKGRKNFRNLVAASKSEVRD
jgi:thioredoxin-like negative regulator of GroEL